MNVGDKASRMLVHTLPSGIEKFFAMAHEESAKPGGPNAACVNSVAAEHGFTFV